MDVNDLSNMAANDQIEQVSELPVSNFLSMSNSISGPSGGFGVEQTNMSELSVLYQN